MLEILGYITGGLTLGGAVLGIVWYAWEQWQGYRSIP